MAQQKCASESINFGSPAEPATKCSGKRVVPAPLRVVPGQRRLICREDADAKMLAIGIDAQMVRGTLDAPQHKGGIQ